MIKTLGIGSILLALVWSGCVTYGKKTPEDAARTFFEKLNKMDFDNANKYATEATQKRLHLIRTEFNMSNAEERLLMQQNLQMSFKLLQCNEIDGQMICKVCCGADSSEATVPMVQRDGAWLVDMPE